MTTTMLTASVLLTLYVLCLSSEIVNENKIWNKFLFSIFTHLKWNSVVFVVENDTAIEEIILQLHHRKKASAVLSVSTGKLMHVSTSLDFLYEKEKKLQTVIDVESKNFKTLLQMMRKNPMLWSQNSHWLVKSENLWFLNDQTVSILINREINIAFSVFNKTERNYFIYTLNCEENIQPISFKVMNWSGENKMSVFYRKPSYIKDLKGKRFKFALERHFPFYIPSKNVKIPKPTGIDIYLLDTLSQFLNFSYEVSRPPDKKWGSKKNGTWNGMIGMVYRQEVHGALGGMSVISSRMEVVDFSKSYAFDRIAFVIRSPDETSRKWVIFRPFKWEVWLALTLAILLVALCLFAAENSFWYLAEEYKLRQDIKLKNLKMVRAVLLIYKAMVYQDCCDPMSNSGKVLIVSWWIFVITIIAGYSGTLVSFMTNPGRENPVDTISELVSALKSKTFSCGTISDSASHEIFRTSPSSIFKSILESMESKQSNFVKNDKEGLMKCKNENYAYIAGQLTTEADIEEKGKFLFSRDSFQFFGYGIAFTQNFWYRNDFDRIILRLRYTGIIDRKIQKYIEEQQKYFPEIVEQRVLSLFDLQGAFFVLLIGLLISFVVFIIELVVSSLKQLALRKNCN